MTQEELKQRLDILEKMLNTAYQEKESIKNHIKEIKMEMLDIKNQIVSYVSEYEHMIGSVYEYEYGGSMYRIDNVISKNGKIYYTGQYLDYYENCLSLFEEKEHEFKHEYVIKDSETFEKHYKEICDKLNLQPKL